MEEEGGEIEVEEVREPIGIIPKLLAVSMIKDILGHTTAMRHGWFLSDKRQILSMAEAMQYTSVSSLA